MSSLFSALAAHPGHGAPPLHAHGDAVFAVGAIVIVVVAGFLLARGRKRG